MGYGADFASVGASASGGNTGPGLLTRKLTGGSNASASSGGGGGASTNDSGESTSADDSADTSSKKYNPKKHMKHMKVCHKKHTHSKSCGRK